MDTVKKILGVALGLGVWLLFLYSLGGWSFGFMRVVLGATKN